MDAAAIATNLEAVRHRIAAAAARAGRRADDVELVAVSKTFPAEAVRAAWEAGQELFGENKVQEAAAKIPDCPGASRWHLIGHLQSNKIRRALPLFDLIHSVDSLDLARGIERVAEEEGHRPRVLLEVNVSGEGTKYGFAPDALAASMEELLTLKRVTVEGLMTMAPFADDAELARPHFRRLRELRDRLERDFGAALPVLSMGMSGDFEVGVEEGATLVRVGSAIFGAR